MRLHSRRLAVERPSCARYLKCPWAVSSLSRTPPMETVRSKRSESASRIQSSEAVTAPMAPGDLHQLKRQLHGYYQAWHMLQNTLGKAGCLCRRAMAPNPIERTSSSKLRLLPAAARVERSITMTHRLRL